MIPGGWLIARAPDRARHGMYGHRLGGARRLPGLPVGTHFRRLLLLPAFIVIRGRSGPATVPMHPLRPRTIFDLAASHPPCVGDGI